MDTRDVPAGRPPHALALIVSVALVIAACSPAGSAASDPGNSPAVSVPAASAAPSDASEKAPWAVVGESPVETHGFFVTDIAASGSTVVVTGAIAPNGMGVVTQAGFWVSTEDGAWVQGSVTSGPATGWPEAITAGGAGFVAVGWDGCGGPWPYYDTSECTTAVWSSADGLDWQRVGQDRPNTVLTSVVTWDGQLYAAGGAEDPDRGTSRALVLETRNGTDWDEHEAAGQVPEFLIGALAVGADELVAIAQYRQSDGEGGAGAWSSADGTTWEGPHRLPGNAIPAGIVSTGTGYAAVAIGFGSEFVSIPVAWIGDGEWRRLAAVGEEEGDALTDVASGPAGALIVGFDSDTPSHPLLYGSVDGVAWLPLTPDGALADGMRPMSVTWQDGRFLIAAMAGEGHEQLVVLKGLPHLPAPEEVAASSPLPTPPSAIAVDGDFELHLASGLDVTLSGTGTCSGLRAGPMQSFSVDDLGSVAGHRVYLNVTLNTEGGDPSIEIGRGAEEAPAGQFLAPYYSDEGTSIRFSGDATDWIGRLDFTDMSLVHPDMEDIGEVVPMGGVGGPQRIDGWITWACP